MTTALTANIKRLSKKHQLFVEAFIGCPMEAAQIAGYQGEPESLRSQGNRLLADPLILQAIKDRSKYLNKMGNAIAVKDERQMFWTSIMNNKDPHHMIEKDAHGIAIPETNIQMGMRLKASELLGKSEGDFVDRIDITAKLSISDVIKESYDTARSIEDIEADYIEVQESEKVEVLDEAVKVDYENLIEDTHSGDSAIVDLESLI